MEIKIVLNGKSITDFIEPDSVLIDFLRDHSCYSVKRGCDTSNCGICTVLMDDKPVLSCSMLTARANGHKICAVCTIVVTGHPGTFSFRKFHKYLRFSGGYRIRPYDLHEPNL